MADKLNMYTDPVSGLQFWSEKTDTYEIKFASGWLTNPNTSPRKKKLHEDVSEDTGDDAGHLIARTLGGPDHPANFGRQNSYQNRWGTWRKAERIWKKELKANNRVKVLVQEKTFLKADDNPRHRTDRAFYRVAEWWVKTPQGMTHDIIAYLNSESDSMRKAMGIEVKQHYTNNVLSMSDYR